MRLVQMIHEGFQCVGIEKNNDFVIDLTKSHHDIPDNMIDFLKGGEHMMKIAEEISSNSNHLIKKNEVKILPPINNCEKIICVGMNYKDHCDEHKVDVPDEPVIFSKFPSSIIGDGDNILIPQISDRVDWEVELAVIIGKQGKHIKKNEAMEYVAGYSVACDINARDWQSKSKNGDQCLLGTTFDTFCPIGPVLVTRNNIEDPGNLNLRCYVNGELMQDGNTNQMVFNVEACIAWVSIFCTLKPGDILLTGTPPGVGAFRDPPIFLKAGDVMVCKIENIGEISNSVVDEV